ncbi:MAG: glycosyltransferase family 39 protein [Verrucomicrobiaceae bacterium]|nr:glycosyltransferase family 39 protein [Verrucomicrobiaceae bacterium]
MSADKTLLAGVLNTGEPGNDAPVFYMHHPPMLVWVLALARRTFGGAEWAARLPILFALAGSAFLVLTLGQRWLGRSAGWAATFLFVLMPAAGAFGMHVDVHGPLTLLPALGIVHAWDRIRTGDRRGHLWMLFWLTLGVLTDWPICYLPLILWLHAVGTRASGGLPKTLFLHGVFAAVVLALVLAHMAVVRGGLAFLFDQLAHRTFHLQDDHASGFGPMDWLRKEGSHLRILYSIPVLALSLWWLAMQFWPKKSDQRRCCGILLLLTFGALDVLLGFQASFVHDAWSIFLWPGIALAATSGVWQILRSKSPGVRWVTLTIITAWMRADGPPRPLSSQIDEWAGFSCLEMAQVIRAESQPDEAVMIPGQWDCSPALFYYADRTMAPFVGDVPTFEQALAGDGFYGPLGFTMRSQKTIVAAVLPLHSVSDMVASGLIDAIEDRGWQRTVRDEFVVYRPPTPHGEPGQGPLSRGRP